MEFLVATDLFNQFHPKFPSTMREQLERACFDRTVQCLDLRNCLLPKLDIQFPAKVTKNLTPRARWRGWDMVPLEDAARHLATLGLVLPLSASPAESLMTLSGGPSNLTKAWTSLTLLKERELLPARLAGLTGSVEQYLAAASGLPTSSLVYIRALPGNGCFHFLMLLIQQIMVPGLFSF